MSQSSGEKTEQPTDKKLRDARKRGQIAKSNDVTTTFVTIFVLAAVAYVFETVVRKFRELFAGGIAVMNNDAPSAFSTMTGDALQTLILVILPIAAACIVGTLAGSYFQFGFVFAPESMKPDLNKLNPIEGTKKIFALKNLMEFVKSLLKVSVLSLLLYFIIKDSIDPLMQLPLTDIQAVPGVFEKMFLWFILPFMGVYVVVAAADYFLQKFLFTREMKMTKDEVKREYKQQEGSPEIKGQRKSLHREMINEDTVGKTKSATVLVTNPTHYAVGLYYEPGITKLPKVTVKGVDSLAFRMIDVAKDNQVPVVQNARIARHLYDNVKLDDFIPNEMLAPIAEILKWVQTLPKRQ
jgi:type III secretion protein U